MFAADVARRYGKVVLEDFDLRRVATRAKHGGQADELPAAARHYRVMAATSTLRSVLVNACQREGVTVEVVPAQNTTRMCHVCGCLDFEEDPAELVHTCSDCRARTDQDANAAVNLMALTAHSST